MQIEIRKRIFFKRIFPMSAFSLQDMRFENRTPSTQQSRIEKSPLEKNGSIAQLGFPNP
jgi:hypothetical protein